MKHASYQQIRVISCNDPLEFQRQFNAAQAELATKNPTVQFNMAQGHCAYITYTITKDIPETAEDEFELSGIRYRCRNCPEFEWPMKKDGTIHRSKKRSTCRFAEYGIANRDEAACEHLYRGIAQGTLRAIEDEDLELFRME